MRLLIASCSLLVSIAAHAEVVDIDNAQLAKLIASGSIDRYPNGLGMEGNRHRAR